jgi:UDP-2,3-diacylglucosamine hydrolase
MQLPNNKKFILHPISIAPTPELSFPREQKFVAWLDEIKSDAEALFLLGDLFDFWFEYKTVVPKVSSVFWVN